MSRQVKAGPEALSRRDKASAPFVGKPYCPVIIELSLKQRGPLSDYSGCIPVTLQASGSFVQEKVTDVILLSGLPTI